MKVDPHLNRSPEVMRIGWDYVLFLLCTSIQIVKTVDQINIIKVLNIKKSII